MSNEKIGGVVKKIFGKKVHFNASGSGDPEAAWSQYIKKQMRLNCNFSALLRH
jgi:hypothetical protein